jgi:hypothetical protein
MFAQNSGAGPARGTPVLAYTWYPVVSFQERGGGLVSALVSLLLSHGFQLALSPEYPDLLDQVQPTAASCKCTLTADNFLKFSIDGELLHSEQLNPRTTDDAEWIAAATHTGQTLMISGDHLRITHTGLDLQPAARQASLLIGNVPFTRAPNRVETHRAEHPATPLIGGLRQQPWWFNPGFS